MKNPISKLFRKQDELSRVMNPSCRFSTNDPDERYRMRLMTIAMAIVMVNMITGVFMTTGEERFILRCVAPWMVPAFLLTRTRFYKLGTAIALLATFVFISLAIFRTGMAELGIIIPLTYFTATIFMVSFWMKVRWLLLLFFAQMGIVFLGKLITPDANDIVLFGWFPLNTFVGALIILSRWVQTRNEERLDRYREHLEELVESRSEALREANLKLQRKYDEEKILNAELETAISQKDTLLRELYHRTKNNLQIISSLLQLQSSQTKDVKTKELFTVARDRIRSMALIHEKLLKSKNLDVINLEEYIRTLADELLHTHAVKPGGIEISYDCTPLNVSIDQAVPLGFVVNELLTNSLKYAFPENTEGRIHIHWEIQDETQLILYFSDDGIGFPEGFDPRKSGGLGYRLIYNIVEAQLNGSFEVSSERGVHGVLKCPLVNAG